MKNSYQKILYSFCLILLSASIYDAQNATEKFQWTTIESPKKDLSFTIPSIFLVDSSENQKHFVFASQDNVMMSVGIEETTDAKSRLEFYRTSPTEYDFKISQFSLNDFTGYVHKFEKEDNFRMVIYMASSKSFCTLSVSSKDVNTPALAKFIASIKINNKPLFDRKMPPVEPDAPAVSISSLKTDSVISEALKRKSVEKREIKYDLSKVQEEVKDEKNYSRELIVLRKPQPSYTDRARMSGISGKVRLRILFRASGEVGDILMLSKLGGGLDKNAADAASRIKFLPAEIDGKPVDVYKEVTYAFVIY